jgi:hypothetical protein
MPTTGVAGVCWGFGVVPASVVGWAVLGVMALMIAVAGSRSSVTRFSVLKWQNPGMDTLVQALVYNGVLTPSIAVTQVAWAATESVLVGTVLAIVMPVWFLKHLQFVLTLTTPRGP